MTDIMKNKRCWGLLLLSLGFFWLLAAKPYAEPFRLSVPLNEKRLVSLRDMGRQTIGRRSRTTSPSCPNSLPSPPISR